MSEAKQTQPTEQKKKGGRPVGYSPKQETKHTLAEEDGDYVLIRVPKKQLAKLLLKDLI
jgi:hypothetical protein